MRFLFRWAFRLLILLVVLAVAAILLKDTIVKAVAENRLRAQTGCDVRIGRMEVSLLKPTVTIENFLIYNPAEFGGSPFIDMPELHFEYDRAHVASQKMHLKLLRVNLKELNIVESKTGRTNLDAIFPQGLPGMDSGRDSKRKKEDFPFAGIDILNLTVRKIKFTSLKQPRRNQEADAGLQNEIVTDVRSSDDLAGVTFKALLRAGITIYYSDKHKGKPPKPSAPRAGGARAAEAGKP